MFTTKPQRIFSISVVVTFIMSLAFSALGVTPAYAAGVLYVKPSGVGNCASWAASCNLQTALTSATSGKEIWVAKGTHKPGNTRTATFKLKNGVAVYGGFAGTETTRDQRKPETNVTILSGDIDNNDSQTPIITNIDTVTGNLTNSYHVVTGAGGATIDGFTITAGSADYTAINSGPGGGGMYTQGAPTLVNIIFRGNLAKAGGGMKAEYGNPILTNITFSNNSSGRGGGLAIAYSSITLTNVTFNDNSSEELGGGMDVYASDNIKLTNVTFNNNDAKTEGGGLLMGIDSTGTIKNATFNGNSANVGGGIYCISFELNLENVTFNANSAISAGGMFINETPDVSLKNVTFRNNSATNYGGGIRNYSDGLYIRNTILWGNTSTNGPQLQNNGGIPHINDSVVQGGCPVGGVCTNIITTNPLLGTLDNYGGFTQTIPLQMGSSAIDTGNDAQCLATDQRGKPRPQGAHCDIGAFEYVEPVTETLTVKSVAAQDGWVLESSETSMAGSTFNNSTPTFVLGDDMANKQYRSVLSFNTASLPDSAIVTSVTLKVKQNAIVGGGDPVTTFQGFVADVKTGFFGTAAGLQVADFQAAPSKAIGPLSSTPSSGWYTLNLTNAKSFINKLSTNGGVTQIRLRFKLDDNNDAVANYLSLFSGNATNAADRPQLVIMYYVP